MGVQELPVGFEDLKAPLSREQALLEADRCLECGTGHAPAPCTVACPADVDVPAFVAALARDDVDAAARTIYDANLLGGTCARVCPVETLCVAGCVLPHDGGKPIAINRLQRYATDEALRRGTVVRHAEPTNWHEVAVIGAGPAGLVAAGELAALGYRVTVYDGHSEIGGLVRTAIAPYKIQIDPLPAEAGLLLELGVRFELGIPVETPEALDWIVSGSEAVVLACGMGPDQVVRYEGDELDGVWDSLPFIEHVKNGHPPELGCSVAVIGGGNTAVDVAREAVRLGASNVTMLYRRTAAEAPAYAHEIAEALDEGVKIMWLTNPVRFVGGERLSGVECVRMELGEPDESGRRRPVAVEGSEFVVPADTVVKAIGQRPRNELFELIGGLDVEGGTLTIDPETGRTSNPKFFAAGDVTTGGATVVEAVRQAKIAARGVHAELGGRR